jgi:hypothetical protein
MGTRDIENLDAEDMFNEKDRRNPLVLCGTFSLPAAAAAADDAVLTKRFLL